MRLLHNNYWMHWYKYPLIAGCQSRSLDQAPTPSGGIGGVFGGGGGTQHPLEWISTTSMEKEVLQGIDALIGSQIPREPVTRFNFSL